MLLQEFNRIKAFGLRMSLTEADSGTKVVSKVALLCDGKLCMGKRNDDGSFTEPGGHAEAGESPEQAAIREVEEETGIVLGEDELKPLGHATVENDEGEELEVHAFQADVDSKRTTTKEDPDGEVSKWEWIDISDGRLPSEVSANLHVPAERNVVLQALGLAEKPIGEADEQPKPAPTPKAAKPATPGKPDPAKSMAPTKPAAKVDPPAPVPPSDEKMDAVKKLHKMAEKVFKGLDDMAVFANQNGLKDVANMIGTVEDAYWDLKRSLAKIRESRDDRVLAESRDNDLVDFIAKHGVSKPTEWADYPMVTSAPSNIRAAIKKLPVVGAGKSPSDHVNSPSDGLCVALGRQLAFVIDTSGYNYARYMMSVPRSWVK